MNRKMLSIALILLTIAAAGTVFAQVGVGLDAGVYIRVSDAGKGRNVERLYIGDRLSDGSCLVSYHKANGDAYWEGRGKITPGYKRYLGVYFGSSSTSTYDLEILSSTSFKFQGAEFRLASR